MNALFVMSQGASQKPKPPPPTEVSGFSVGRAYETAARAQTGEVLSSTDGSVTISRRQRDVHVFFETLAVLVAAPFSIWLATRKELPDWARALSGMIGVGTIIVDGGLLVQYMRERKRQNGV